MTASSRRESRNLVPHLYCGWATLAIGLSLAVAGFNSESITRLLVLVFLGAQLGFRHRWRGVLPSLSPRVRFVVLGSVLAAVVEGFHMISTPVFASLRIDRATTVGTALSNYALDLAFTLPAYLLIFSLIWSLVSRYRFSLWGYIITFGLAQTVGDGGLFFFSTAPWMLVFIPYPMSNYHAINITPYLAVRDGLSPGRTASLGDSCLAILAVVATYLACGAVIQYTGRLLGLT